MLKSAKLVLSLVAFGMLAGCANRPAANYDALHTENPRSILVIQPVNLSTEVTAPTTYLTTISMPLAEKGYYVFPINLVKQMMDEDGLSDSDMVHNGDPTRLGEMFGADAILYVRLVHWEAKYMLISTTLTVEMEAELKSAKTGQSLWKNNAHVDYSPQAQSGGGLPGLIVKAVSAALTKATPDYTLVADMANTQVLNEKERGLLDGPRKKNK